MKKEEPIMRYTVEQIDEMLSQGQSKTDWKRVQDMSEEEIERNAATDSDSPSYPYPADFWKDVERQRLMQIAPLAMTLWLLLVISIMSWD